MPTTPLKNTLYRLALPLRAPCLERSPELSVQGGPLRSQDTYIRLLRRHHVLGSALLLRDDSRAVQVYCSSQNPRHQVSENSMFRVASITKMATALAVLHAVEEERLALDQPFLSFFPELRRDIPELDAVSPLHLLSHTAGLRDPEGMEQALLKSVPFPDIISGCRISAPGSEFHYSNLGFGLLGCLLEQVYDLPVAQVVDQLVFQPLGMKSTLDCSTLVQSDIVPISRVLPYRPGQDVVMTPLGAIPQTAPSPCCHYGYTAGAMYTDLFSLARLLDCLRSAGQPLLSPNLCQNMLRRHASYGKISPTLSYGLGILRIEDSTLSDSVILGHQGFAYGCADGAFWEESTGRTVIFLNGGASEARRGRLGCCNYDILKWALHQEMPQWKA